MAGGVALLGEVWLHGRGVALCEGCGLWGGSVALLRVWPCGRRCGLVGEGVALFGKVWPCSGR